MIKGLVLSCIAGSVGAAAWAAVGYYTGYEVGLIAWLVGVFAGLGMAAGAKARVGVGTGLVAVVVAVGCILVGKFVVVHLLTEQELGSRLTELKRADENDGKAVLARQLIEEYESQGKALNWPKDVTRETVGKLDDLPADLRKDLETRWAGMDADYRQKYVSVASDMKSAKVDLVRAKLEGRVFGRSFSLLDIVWLVLAIASAFRIGSGRGGDAGA